MDLWPIVNFAPQISMHYQAFAYAISTEWSGTGMARSSSAHHGEGQGLCWEGELWIYF